jgi:hypothetical protein
MRRALLTVALGLAACAHGPRTRAIEADVDPFATLVRFESHVGWGIRVERVLVVLDGAVQYNQRDFADGAPLPRYLFGGQLPAGDHVVQVLVEASIPSGILDEPRVTAELRSSHSFTVTRSPMTLDVDFYSTSAAEQRPEDLALWWRERPRRRSDG